MANEYKCFLCGGDGTRCDCYRRTRPPVRTRTVQERITDNDEEYKSLIFQMRTMRLRKAKKK